MHGCQDLNVRIRGHRGHVQSVIWEIACDLPTIHLVQRTGRNNSSVGFPTNKLVSPRTPIVEMLQVNVEIHLKAVSEEVRGSQWPTSRQRTAGPRGFPTRHHHHLPGERRLSAHRLQWNSIFAAASQLNVTYTGQANANTV